MVGNWYFKCPHVVDADHVIDFTTPKGSKQVAKICETCKNTLNSSGTVKLTRSDRSIDITQANIDGTVTQAVKKISLDERIEEILLAHKEGLSESTPFDKRKTAFYTTHNEIKVALEADGKPTVELDLKWTAKTDKEDTSRRLMARNSEGKINAIVLGGKLSLVTYLNGLGIALGHSYSHKKRMEQNWGFRIYRKLFPEDYDHSYGRDKKDSY